MTMTQRDTDALPSVRACVTALPEQLLSPPYEMRSEMNWIDFSGTANPLGTPPSFIRAMETALAAGELNYPPDREAHALRSVLARKFGLSVESFLVGSTVGEVTTSDTIDVHFEKAFATIPGAYPMLCREFARQIMADHPNIVYLNREDDMGHENLRSAKLEYYPEFLLAKYTAREAADV